MNLEKEQIQNSKIDCLLFPDGQCISDPGSMLDCANNFYSNLYKSEVLYRIYIQLFPKLSLDIFLKIFFLILKEICQRKKLNLLFLS